MSVLLIAAAMSFLCSVRRLFSSLCFHDLLSHGRVYIGTHAWPPSHNIIIIIIACSSQELFIMYVCTRICMSRRRPPASRFDSCAAAPLVDVLHCQFEDKHLTRLGEEHGRLGTDHADILVALVV